MFQVLLPVTLILFMILMSCSTWQTSFTNKDMTKDHKEQFVPDRNRQGFLTLLEILSYKLINMTQISIPLGLRFFKLAEFTWKDFEKLHLRCSDSK